MKTSGYKYQIEQELVKKDWEIIEIYSSREWWDDEHWRIKFKYDYNKSFFLCFIVDPAFEGQRKKGQGIYEIKASTKFPLNWDDSSNEITTIIMTKRKFDDKLKKFIGELEEYKKSKTL